MNAHFNDDIARLRAKINDACNENRRYRTAWVLGPPRVGKSWQCRAVCEAAGWHYFNFTTEFMGLQSLWNDEAPLTPERAIGWVHQQVAEEATPVLLIDEVDPLLSFWPPAARRTFLQSAARAKDLPCGVVWVVRWEQIQQELPSLVPQPATDKIITLPLN